MSWEEERHDWSKLRTRMGAASPVPVAIEELRTASTTEAAKAAYWRIDGVVVEQRDYLHEAAPATTACLVSALWRCTEVARPFILEMLYQLAAAYPFGVPRHDPHVTAQQRYLQERCAQEMSVGFGLYCSLLESGTTEEQLNCIDLLGVCAWMCIPLRASAAWYLRRFDEAHSGQRHSQLIDNWLEGIE